MEQSTLHTIYFRFFERGSKAVNFRIVTFCPSFQIILWTDFALDFAFVSDYETTKINF